MKTLLAIDAGNSSVKYGLFRDGQLVESSRHEVFADEQVFADLLQKFDAPVALASVAPSATEIIERLCATLERPLLKIRASSQSILSGMNDTMGADRVADAVAAWKLHGKGKDVLVMGFGTATTLLAITAEGAIVGGWIAPGLAPTLEVLHDRCQLLPLLKMEAQSEAFGNDTATHMRNGVWLGHIGMVKQWLASGRKGLRAGRENAGDVVTVATGGWSQAVQDFEALFDVVDRNLTLEGVGIVANDAGFGKPEPEPEPECVATKES